MPLVVVGASYATVAVQRGANGTAAWYGGWASVSGLIADGFALSTAEWPPRFKPEAARWSYKNEDLSTPDPRRGQIYWAEFQVPSVLGSGLYGAKGIYFTKGHYRSD